MKNYGLCTEDKSCNFAACPCKDPEELWTPTIEFVGPMALHNMPCAVCRKEFAVFETNYGYFSPCWRCKEKGWATARYPEFSLFEFISNKLKQFREFLCPGSPGLLVT
jgi:hypothetical protein